MSEQQENEARDPFEKSRKSMRKFLASHLDEESAKILEPHASAAMIAVIKSNPKTWIQKNPRISIVAGVGLVLAGGLVAYKGAKHLTPKKKPTLKSV
jgi:hypothetical protein